VQRDEGSRLVAADTARWILVWAAPAAGGTVLVHAAGNAADGDDSALDDFVYTGVWSAEPAGR
jgi:hypothetical protein